jgi:HK97 family phage prohead protease
VTPVMIEMNPDDLGERAGQIPMAEYRRTDDGDVVTPKLERRRASKIEIRAAGDKMVVEGYATVYGAPYDVGGMFTETIERGAAAKSAQEADVVFLFDHDGLPLARTKSGTMTLSSDDTGLLVRAELSQNSTTARDLVDAINRGDVDEMSFAFQVVRQSWNQDRSERSISEVKLVDVSAVTYPANPATHIQIADDPQPARSAGMSVALARAVIDSRR